MPHSNQEILARRCPSFDPNNPVAGEPHYNAGYDCEPPPNVRSELVAPRDYAY